MAYELKHRTLKTIEKGTNYPLGATLMPEGVNFAVYSQHATEVFLLLFDKPDGEPTDIIQLIKRDKFIWHALVKGLKAGQIYGYKARGEYRPEWGFRFNEAKVLLDPYAKAVTGKFRNVDGLLLAHESQPAAKDDAPDKRDNTTIVPKAIVVDDAFDWQGVSSPDLTLEQLIIYEVHVKSFTAHPSSGARFPGTYLGFMEKIPHLTQLGINAVEFLPVHEYHVDDFLIQKGLTNYWGYNSIGFFAPESPDLTWFAPDLGHLDWQNPNARTLCYQLDSAEDGSDVRAERLFFILNANSESQWVSLPALDSSLTWHRAIDTSLSSGEDFAESGNEILIDPPDHYIANARSVVVLLAQKPKPGSLTRETGRGAALSEQSSK